MASWWKKFRYGTGYLLLRFLLALSGWLPLGLLRRFFGWAVGLFAPLARSECQCARENLRLAFGEDADCEGILKACARHLGELVGEALWLARSTPAAVLEKTRFQGLEHLQQALAQGRGVVLVTGHCGNWEWMNLALQAAGLPMTSLGRQLRDSRLHRLVAHLRTRFGGEAVFRGGSGASLLRALRRGRVVGLLIDQDIQGPGVFVSFFGRPAWTPIGAAVLALRAQCPVVLGFARRTAEGDMEILFSPPIQTAGTSADEEQVALLTAQLTRAIEEHIRRVPEQWVWFHRRFRRRPSPEDPVWSPERYNPQPEGER